MVLLVGAAQTQQGKIDQVSDPLVVTFGLVAAAGGLGKSSSQTTIDA